MSNGSDLDLNQFIQNISEPSFASMRRQAAEALLLEIAKCPIALQCLENPRTVSPCATIVSSQRSSSSQPFHIPEPWSGDITRALILFIASNPSISQKEQYPNLSWGDGEITDFFMNRFGNGRQEWIREGTRGLRLDGTYASGTAFWRFVRNRAEELLERAATPGVDYALTEIARCKSEGEAGVTTAATVCSERYLERTIAAARAPVIVALGSWARASVGSLLSIQPQASPKVFGPVAIGNRDRLVAFLPHANARTERTFKTFPDDLMRQVRDFVRAEE